MLKVSFGSLKQSADYNFLLEFLILPSTGWLKPTCDTHTIQFYYSVLLYDRAALAWTKKKPKKKKSSIRNEKLKANRASEIEEQRKERLRIRREKDRARRRIKNKRKGKSRQKQKTMRNRAWPLSKD